MWRPGASAPAAADLDREGGEFAVLNAASNKRLPIARQRQLLPIYSQRTALLHAVETHRTVVVVGETGSGKTTQLPQYLHEAGWTAGGRRVVCTQPRRVAAITVAARVAEEMGRELGGVVGYAVRFDDKTCDGTCIKYCTDGLLVREALQDPLLTRVSVVIVDEAHERSLHTDVLLGLLKKVQKKRPDDFKVIIASATLDAEKFRDFFETNRNAVYPGEERPADGSGGGKAKKRKRSEVGGGKGKDWKGGAAAEDTKPTCVIASVAGRMHPVDILYSEKPIQNYVRAAVEAVVSINRHEGEGDILVFLPGMEEVDEAVYMLKETDAANGMVVLPLYGALPAQQQMRVFDRPTRGMRKVVFSTNIAETSITIDGVKHVVDAGFVRLPYFNPKTGIESLVTAPISRASAKQRAGRAGRTSPGKCVRLFTEAAYLNTLVATTPPEMQRTSLTWAVLQLKALGIDDILHFDFISPPTSEAMMHALEILFRSA